MQSGRQAGRQAGKSIAITTNSRNGKQFEMRITFYVFAGVFHLVFLHFPLFHFATFLFWSVFFFSFCSCCSCSGSARMVRACLDCLAKHVHCDFVHEIHVVVPTWRPTWAHLAPLGVHHRSWQLTGVCKAEMLQRLNSTFRLA